MNWWSESLTEENGYFKLQIKLTASRRLQTAAGCTIGESFVRIGGQFNLRIAGWKNSPAWNNRFSRHPLGLHGGQGSGIGAVSLLDGLDLGRWGSQSHIRLVVPFKPKDAQIQMQAG